MSPPSNVNGPPELNQTFSRMVTEYGSKLRRFIAGRSRSPHSANDLAQEVYLRLLRFPSEDVIGNPAAYMYRVAANVVHDFNLRHRNERVRFDSDALQELAERTADVWVDDLGDQCGASQEVERLVNRLPTLLQTVLILCKRDGHSYEEVAQQLGISAHTVKKHLADAIALCRVWAGQR